MWNLDGGITGANEAFLRMVQYDREDLASGRVTLGGPPPAEWRGHAEQAVADLKATGMFQPSKRSTPEGRQPSACTSRRRTLRRKWERGLSLSYWI